ncbi:ATP-grasp domain-containing protein [Plesiomonas shigelloides]|uniref:ATP-grasp domain-containing protein n=1 Tax=Plesiomonas shigelloides TaxID=703 RepID=UPI002FC8138E
MKIKNKTILIIGAGVEACEGIKIAKSMGLSLIIADGNDKAPGFSMADWKIIASTYDGEEILKKTKNLIDEGVQVHGVMAMCADVPLSVAIISNALQLPGISIQSAIWVSDKLKMKERLKSEGIPIPNFADVSDKSILLVKANEIGFPLIIKPVDSRGARGVQLIESASQLTEAWTISANESPTSRVMIEEYLDGPQFSTETLIDNKKCYTLGFADRNYEWLEKTKPFIIENGGDSPTAVNDSIKNEIISVVEKAALALGINSGVAKGDMVYTNKGAKVIEIAGRLSGGYFSTTQIPLATGVDFVYHAIKIALGERINKSEVTPQYNNAVAIRYLTLPEGKVKRISGISNAEKAPGVEMLKVFIQEGSNVGSISNHTQRSGFVIATANDKYTAIKNANDALSMIKVEYTTNE